MAKNETSSNKLAKLAGEVLGGEWDTTNHENLLKVAYALAGSVLTQAPDKKKDGIKRKTKKK